MSDTLPAPRVGETFPLPLSRLVLDRNNPRTACDKEADPVMVGSIRSRGLLHNLGVAPSSTSHGKYVVKYGNRRLLALRALTREGHFGKDEEFSCRLVADKEEDANGPDALEAQIAENIVRAAMSPIDEYEAFAKLVSLGLSVEEIARRFGAEERAVRQRLALGQAAPCVRQALRDEEISLDIARIFAGCPDTARQERVFKEIAERGQFTDWSVRKALHQGSLAASDMLVRFVGLESYEAAGGVIDRDLFSDDVRLADVDLIIRLRDEKLAAEVERLSQEGWSWVEAHEGHSYDLMNGIDRLYGEIVPLSGEDQAKADKIRSEIDALIEKNADSDDWSDEDSDRYDELEIDLSEIQEVRRVFTAEQKAVSGCIIYPGKDGVTIHEGLVRKADRKKAKALNNDSADENGATGAANSEKDADTLSGGLTIDLNAFRNQAVQAALVENPGAAIRFLHFTLVRNIFKDAYAARLGLGISAPRADYRIARGELAETTAAAMLERAESRLRTDILEAKDDLTAWNAFSALSAEEQNALTAFAIAQTVEPQRNGFLDGLGAELGIEIRAYWQPTAENFFSRIKKDQLIAFLRETVGDKRAAHLTRDYKAKKSELVDLCEALIDDTAPAKPDARAALDAWAPPMMAFAPCYAADAATSSDEVPDAA